MDSYDKRYSIFILFVLMTAVVFGEEKSTLRGKITDAANGEYLVGANIWLPGINAGTTSNAYGHYSIQVDPGSYNVEISYAGYKKAYVFITISSDTVLDWQLTPGVELAEVEVKASTIRQAQPLCGIKTIEMKTVELGPAMLGEADAIKLLQALPGVKSGNEGTAGIQVRGGSHDQNLIMLDGIPVYNTNHLFGYISTFHTDALKDMKFYKGSIPARYGGRLSSIIDIRMKEGNLKKLSGNLSVSPVAGSIMLEGPIKKDTASFLIASRRTWLDIPLRIYQAISSNSERLGYSFYDINAKGNWMINSKNRVYLSHYQGRDKYFSISKNEYNGLNKTTNHYSFQWENYTTLLRINSVLAPGLFVNTSFYHSLYRFGQINEITGSEKYKEATQSGLNEIAVKGDFDLSLPKSYAKFGYHVSNQWFKPEIISVMDNNTDTVFNSSAMVKSQTFSLYAENEWKLFKGVIINSGVRSQVYLTNGKKYISIEPRLAVGFQVNKYSELKTSVQKMVQPLHLLTNNALNMPTDLWVPATTNIKPATAWQFDLGYSGNFIKGYDVSCEFYYKQVKDIIQYKQGVSFLRTNSKTWQELVDVGDALNYGAEFMAEKNNGKITGWINYTLAWAWLKFENINNNQYFPFKYDRRHDLNILCNYHLLKTTQRNKYISAMFKYSTGNAITIPVEIAEGIVAPGTVAPNGSINYYPYKEPEYFPHPNNYRMPAFHHLDIAYTSSKITKKNNERIWKYSVYNIYNRLNPYYFVKRYTTIYQVSMLPIIPSVSFTYKW